SQVAGVRSVAAAKTAPFIGSSTGMRIRTVEAGPQVKPLEPGSNPIFSASYFQTLGIPLLKGRMFEPADFEAARRGNARTIIVNDRLARSLFGTSNPLGREV